MFDLKEFYILGLPIETELGELHFVKIKDMPMFAQYQNILTISKDKIIYLFLGFDEKKDIWTSDWQNKFKEFKDNILLYDLIIQIQELHDLYIKLFDYLFKTKNIFQQVTRDNFNYYRNLIMKMNCINEEEFNPNPEIRKWQEKSKRAKQDGKPIEFQDMISSVVVGTGLTYEQVCEMTLYQFYTTFRRLSAFKEYDTSTLFATVSTEKIKIEQWCKNIDLFEVDKSGYTREEYNKMKGNIFGGN